MLIVDIRKQIIKKKNNYLCNVIKVNPQIKCSKYKKKILIVIILIIAPLSLIQTALKAIN